MSAEQLLTLAVQAALGLLLWGLKTALTDLKKDIGELRTTLWNDTVRKAELAEVKVDVAELYSKCNALAVTCAKQHGK
jgi:hypothetical protein